MTKEEFKTKLNYLEKKHKKLIEKRNKPSKRFNGIYTKFKNPVITAEHAPINWRFDLNYETNPYLQERLGINAALNAGAIEYEGKNLIFVRVEGYDRKSFFAVAESENGIDNFKFWDYPILMPETEVPDTNIYDIRITKHQDGWYYGLFCTERHDESKPEDTSAAVAACGIARTKTFKDWERLPDLITYSGQQRNVVLHEEFVDGKYALFTRPQDGFIETGKGGGIGWGLTESMENAEIKDEIILHHKAYHTIYELKNGMGPAPIKTKDGWLNLAHGVRNTAAGFRYVLYLFLTSLKDPSKIIAIPGGYFIAPEGKERVGDVSNVTFSNGWIAKESGEVFIYYASSDTRLHVATSTIDQLLDYVKNTPLDRLRSYTSVEDRNTLINNNLQLRKNI